MSSSTSVTQQMGFVPNFSNTVEGSAMNGFNSAPNVMQPMNIPMSYPMFINTNVGMLGATFYNNNIHPVEYTQPNFVHSVTPTPFTGAPSMTPGQIFISPSPVPNRGNIQQMFANGQGQNMGFANNQMFPMQQLQPTSPAPSDISSSPFMYVPNMQGQVHQFAVPVQSPVTPVAQLPLTFVPINEQMIVPMTPVQSNNSNLTTIPETNKLLMEDSGEELEISNTMMVPLTKTNDQQSAASRSRTRSKSPNDFARQTYSKQQQRKFANRVPPGFENNFQKNQVNVPLPTETPTLENNHSRTYVEAPKTKIIRKLVNGGSRYGSNRNSESEYYREPRKSVSNRRNNNWARRKILKRENSRAPKKFGYRTKQIKIDIVYESLRQTYEDIIAPDEIVLRGPNVLRLHVKKYDALCAIEDALARVESEPGLRYSRISMPMSMKNKYQKKGFLVYCEMEDVSMIPQTLAIFQSIPEFKKCQVAPRKTPVNVPVSVLEEENVRPIIESVMIENIINDIDIHTDVSVQNSDTESNVSRPLALDPEPVRVRGSYEVPMHPGELSDFEKDPDFLWSAQTEDDLALTLPSMLPRLSGN